ncbi:SpaH/EbpB family LPXTG-anchored major pilin [Aerococcaceae bacterium zg-BR9]|uniref:SpaH/EbpB family LPXTG-anchored major pilin n=1 Tax=Aerococcaceae bacterium zg-1292 TaxID=2774330 RepID=UPI0040647370|nr:SpaH/EbpB family LPXTG-anchored major pilin [Aerococcaceae bacterium zg-BR9]MBF6626284.1 SpaH/EbpB family LPXTG-anchored major pilin [Aerococcaceae bacterium zg-BR9]
MKFRKLILTAAVVLSTFSPVGFNSVAQAADGAKITVKDTQKDAEYSLYKIFDATVKGDAVSYTIPAGSTIANAPGFSDYFETYSQGGATYVQRKEGKTDAEVTTWVQSLKGTNFVTKVGETHTEDGNDTQEEFAGLDYGYYLVVSSVGTPALAMVTSASPEGIIHEKNTTPGWDDEGGKGKGSKEITNGKDSGNSFNVGEDVEYAVTYNNAMNYIREENKEENKIENKKVYQYVVEDTMPEGVQLDEKSLTVKVNEQTLTVGKDYTYEKTGSGLKVTVKWAATETEKTNSREDEDFFYPAKSMIKLTYKAKVLKTAKKGFENPNENTVTINPNTKTDSPAQKAEFYSGQITIKKVDEQNKPLYGAEFVVKNKSGYLQDNNGEYKWVSEQNDATVYKTVEDGTAVIPGLKAGEYEIYETKAPDGYNILKEPTKVNLTVEQDGLLKTATVENKKGVELPSTGGMGTTIFYVIGGTLVVGAVVFLVAKRKVESE